MRIFLDTALVVGRGHLAYLSSYDPEPFYNISSQPTTSFSSHIFCSSIFPPLIHFIKFHHKQLHHLENTNHFMGKVPLIHFQNINHIFHQNMFQRTMHHNYESQLSSLAEVAHCERSENRGSGGQRAETSQFEAVHQPFGVATVVGFAANVPGGNWVTVGFDSPLVRAWTCIGGVGATAAQLKPGWLDPTQKKQLLCIGNPPSAFDVSAQSPQSPACWPVLSMLVSPDVGWSILTLWLDRSKTSYGSFLAACAPSGRHLGPTWANWIQAWSQLGPGLCPTCRVVQLGSKFVPVWEQLRPTHGRPNAKGWAHILSDIHPASRGVAAHTAGFFVSGQWLRVELNTWQQFL